MYLRTIYIERYGGLENFRLNLSDNFNIIEGDNESGKTTVCSFIKFIFYGFKDKRERNLHMSWNSDSVSGYIIVNFGGRVYRIERECTAGGVDSPRIIDIGTNTTAYNNMNPADVFLGVPSEVYDRTVYVRQADNGHIDGRGIGEAIENMLHSADEAVNTDKALKKLDDARTLLLHKNGKGGRIYELESESENLNIRLQRAVESNHDIIIKDNYLTRLRQIMSDNIERQAEINDEIDNYENVLLALKYKEYIQLSGEIDKIEADTDQIQSEYAGGADFLPNYEYVENIKSCESDIAEYDNEIGNIESQLEKMNEFTPEQEEFMDTLERHGGHAGLVDKIEAYTLQRKTLGIWTSLLGLLFIIFTAAAIFTTIYVHPGCALIFIGSAVCLTAAIVCYVNASHQKIMCGLIFEEFNVKNESQLDDYISSMMDNINNKERADTIFMLQRNRGNMILQRDEKIAELNGYLEMWNKTSASSAVLEAEKYFNLIREKQYALEKLLIRYNPLEQLFDEMEFDGGEFLNMETDGIKSTDIKELRREYDFIHQSNESVKNKIHETEKQLAVLNASSESPSAISDNLAILTDKIKNLRQSHDAYLLAHEKLAEAGIEIKETASPKLTQYASELINRFTSGKYNTLGIGHDLSMEYTSGNKTRGTSYMSAGTLDIAYLSLRMALIKLLYRETDPPVLLDESFARLDDGRLKNVLNLFADINGGGTQILLFTSQKRDAVLMSETGADFNHIILGGNNT